MSYSFVRFGSVPLPALDPETDAGTGPARLNLFDLTSGGAYDADGFERAHSGGYSKQLAGDLEATSAASLQIAFDALRALKGQRNRLYALMGDGSERWVWARCADVQATHGTEPFHDRVTLIFAIESDHWYGARRQITLFLDSGPNVFAPSSLPNAGNYPLTELLIEVHADGAVDITEVDVTTTTGAHWKYTGTLDATDEDYVQIDTGAQAVQRNDSGGWTPDYEHFVLQSDHGIAEWLRLEAGGTGLTVTLTGGSNVCWIYFDYYEAWA